MQDIEIIRKIGCGSYGNVYEAYDHKKGTQRAVKIFKDEFSNVTKWMDQPEVKVMTKIKHKNLVPLKKVVYENNKLFLIMELCVQNLAQLFDERRTQGERFTELEIKKYMRDIIRGVSCLHSNGYLHRDLKPENILVSSDGVLKLTDFGTIKNMKDKLPFTNYVSTRWYRAPECILEVEKYDEKSDVFALGWILAEFYALKPVFWGTSSKDQLIKYCEALGYDQLENWTEGAVLAKKLWTKTSKKNTPTLSNLIPGVSRAGLELITNMLNLNPVNRYSLQDVLQHEFFTSKTTKISNQKIIGEPKKENINYVKDAGKPNDASQLQQNLNFEDYNRQENKEKAKGLIKKNLMVKINKLRQLDLSKVAETDGESSMDVSPSNYILPKMERQRSRFNQYNAKLSEPTIKLKETSGRKSKLEFSSELLSVALPNNSNKMASLGLIDYRHQPLSSRMRTSSSHKLLHPTTENSYEDKFILQKGEFEDLSTMNSRKSNHKSNSGMDSSDHDTQLESSKDELELLRQQVEQKTSSLPVSLKNIPSVQSRYSSRGSVSIGRGPEEKRSSVDKYFTDINGNSLLSTLSSKKDLFADISSNNISKRRQSINVARNSRGFYAANQIIFGASTQSIPAFDASPKPDLYNHRNEASYKCKCST